jgi:hypothetical protein
MANVTVGEESPSDGLKSPLITWNPVTGTRGNCLDKVQLSWTAGIMDGEGHISLFKSVSSNCTRGYRHRTVIVLTNTYLPLVKLFQSWFGGCISIQKNHYLARKTCYQWRPTCLDDQCNFLKQISPYLFIKRKQAEICLDFLENGGRGYMGYRVSDDEFNRRENLCLKIQRLNLRGAEPQRLSEETGLMVEPEAIVRDMANEKS